MMAEPFNFELTLTDFLKYMPEAKALLVLTEMEICCSQESCINNKFSLR